MRIDRVLSAFLLSLLMWPPGLSGQVLPDDPPSSSRFQTVQARQALEAAIMGQQEVEAPGTGHSWRNRVLTGLGAGLLGAGIGFFASQLAESDWDETLGDSKADRSPWALVGGGVGFAIGFSFPLSSAGALGPSFPGGGDRNVISYDEIQEALSGPIGENRENITAAELRRAVVTDALELVNLLRPEWLIQRGVSTFGDPETETIRVYLDNQELGGIDSLELVQVTVIRSIRFLNGARATALFGAGHTQGVIQVLTQD